MEIKQFRPAQITYNCQNGSQIISYVFYCYFIFNKNAIKKGPLNLEPLC